LAYTLGLWRSSRSHKKRLLGPDLDDLPAITSLGAEHLALVIRRRTAISFLEFGLVLLLA
jgi:hypothetical protein